jgi:hypothetical protein
VERLQKEKVNAVGWWELDEWDLLSHGYLNTKKLLSYDVVVILGRSRIHEVYEKLAKGVECALNARRITA